MHLAPSSARLRPSILVAALLACGCSQPAPGAASQPSSGAATTSPPAEQCAALARPAVDQALAAVAAHGACATDADCVTVGVSAACFDVCTRAVAKKDVEAVQAAFAGAACGPFTAAGCAVLHPPCAPPQPPACRAGRCE